MKERLLDVIKWGMIIVIAGIVFYIVSPKYEWIGESQKEFRMRANKITGELFILKSKKIGYVPMSEHEEDKK